MKDPHKIINMPITTEDSTRANGVARSYKLRFNTIESRSASSLSQELESFCEGKHVINVAFSTYCQPDFTVFYCALVSYVR